MVTDVKYDKNRLGQTSIGTHITGENRQWWQTLTVTNAYGVKLSNINSDRDIRNDDVNSDKHQTVIDVKDNERQRWYIDKLTVIIINSDKR